MSDAVIDAAIADFRDAEPQMDSMGNTVVNMDAGFADMPDPASAAEPVAASTEGEATVDATPVETPDGTAAAPQDDIDKLLAKEGVQPNSIRGENRIPYSRTKKIIANAQKEWKTDYDKSVQAERDSWTQERGSLDNYRRQEEVASQDPDRYISLLASVDPRYQKFLGLVGKTGDPAAAATPAADTDPEPQPAKDEQGNPYYTPEGWKNWQSWQRRQAVKEATAEFEKKYGSTIQTVQQREQAAAAYEARRPVVEAQMNRIVSTYGAELVGKHQNAIIEVMQKSERTGAPITADAAAAQVLIPLVRQDEAAIRQKILAEINQRPAAAKGATTPAQKRAVGDDKPLSGDALILAELDRVMPHRNRV